MLNSVVSVYNMKLQVKFYSDRPIDNHTGYFYSTTKGVRDHWTMIEEGDNYIVIETKRSRQLNALEAPINTFASITPVLFESSVVSVTVEEPSTID